jgi:MFS superfamily sulfate permease-like transporter
MKNFVQDRIPFIKWIRAYKIKESLVKDIIAGLTIGVIQIPQGMAYSLMAGLPPVVGLYVSFWAVIVYSFLGTSRHLSTGISFISRSVFFFFLTKCN